MGFQLPKHVTIGFTEALLDNAALVGSYAHTTVVNVATDGFDYAVFNIRYGTSDIAVAACAVYGSDSTMTTSTGGTAITGASLSATDIAAGDDDDTFRIVVDLRNHGYKNLALALTAGDGTNGSWLFAWCDLYGGDREPISATEQGVNTVASA